MEVMLTVRVGGGLVMAVTGPVGLVSYRAVQEGGAAIRGGREEDELQSGPETGKAVVVRIIMTGTAVVEGAQHGAGQQAYLDTHDTGARVTRWWWGATGVGGWGW